MEEIKRNISLVFNADTENAKRSLDELQSKLNSLSKVGSAPGAASSLGITREIREASQAAQMLSRNLAAAVNTDTGALDLSKFAQSMKDSGMSLQKYQYQLSGLGATGKKAFADLSTSIMQAEIPLKKTAKWADELAKSFKNTVRWQISSSLLHGLMSQMQKSVGFAKDLNKSLNDIRIVTGYSSDKMAAFAKEANAAAKALSSTTTAYTDASLIYYQQGLNDQQVKERTDATIKMANVTGQSAKVVSDQMTAVWNNFDDGTKSLESYSDMMTALGAATASSTDEIAQGLSKFAAISKTVGLSYEYATTALATVTAETRQSADIVGTAFKTLFARMEGLKLGETLDDGTSLNKYSQALATIGVNIKDAYGGIKDMDEILSDMGEKWQTLNKDQKIATAQTVAGVRQYNQLISLMDNWDKFQENLATAQNSIGTLNAQQKTYEESWAAASDRVKATAETIQQELFQGDNFISLLNALEKTLQGFDAVLDSVGGLQGLLFSVGAIANRVFHDQIVKGVNDTVYSLKMMTKSGRQSLIDMKMSAGKLAENLFSDSDDQTTAYGYKIQAKEQLKYLSVVEHLDAEQKAILEIMMQQNQQTRERAIAAADELATIQEINREEQKRFTTSAGKDLGPDGKSQIRDLKRKTITASVMENVDAGISSVIPDLRISAQQSPKEFARVKNDLWKDLRKMESGQSISGGASYKSVMGEEGYKSFSKLKAALRSSKTDVSDLEKAYKEWKAYVTEATNAAAKAQESVTKKLEETYNAEEKLGKVTKETSQAEAARINGRKRSNRKKAEEQVQGFTAGVRREETAAFKLGVSTGDIDSGYNKFNQTADDMQQKIPSLSEGFVGLSSGIFSAASAIESFASIWDTIKDPDLTGWQRFSRVAMSLSMGLMMVSQAVSAGKVVIQALTAAENLNTIAKGFNTAATWMNTKAENGLGKARKGSKEAVDNQTENITRNGITKKVGKNGKDYYFDEKTGKFAKGGKEKFEMSPAKLKGQEILTNLKGVGQSIGNFAKSFGPLIAGLAIVAASISLGAKAWHKDAAEAKEATEQATKFNEVLVKAQESYNNLKQAHNTYDEAKKGLKDLKKGTIEYDEALQSANNAALALIESNSSLSSKTTINSDGLIEFEEGALEEARREELKKVQLAQNSKANADAIARSKQIRADQTEFNRNKIKSSEAIGVSKDEGTLIGTSLGVGGGLGLAGAAIGAKLGVTLGTFAPGIGNLIGLAAGAAIGAAVGGAVSLFAKESTTQEDKVLEDLATLYSAEGDSIFANFEDTLRNKLKLDDEKLIQSLLQNQAETRKLVSAMDANTKAHLITQKKEITEKYGEEITKAVNGARLDNTQADVVTTMMTSQLNSKADKLYEDKYKDQTGGLSDAEVQKKYAAMMGWNVDKIDNKNGNKATYYDKKGNVVAEDLSDEVVRLALAEQEAMNGLNSEIAKLTGTLQKINAIEFKDDSPNEIDPAFRDALASFAGGGSQADLSGLSKDQLGQFKETVTNAGLTDEDAKNLGFEDLNALYDKIDLVINSMNENWKDISPVFQKEGISYEQAKSYSDKAEKGQEQEFLNYVNGLSEEQKQIFNDLGVKTSHTVEEWQALMESANAQIALNFSAQMRKNTEEALAIIKKQDFTVEGQSKLYDLLGQMGLDSDQASDFMSLSINEQEERMKDMQLQAAQSEWASVSSKITADQNAKAAIMNKYQGDIPEGMTEEAFLKEKLATKNQEITNHLSAEGSSTPKTLEEYREEEEAKNNELAEQAVINKALSGSTEGSVGTYLGTKLANEFDDDEVAEQRLAEDTKAHDDWQSKKDQLDKEAAEIEEDLSAVTGFDDAIKKNQALLDNAELMSQRASFQSEGLDVAELEDYADHLQAINTESDNLDDNLGENEKAARTVAGGIMKMDKGVEKLAKGFDDWSDILKNSSKSSQEYSKAMGETKDALGDVLGVEKSLISNDFVEKHLEEIGKAAEGDEKAIEKLQRAMSEDILKNLSSGVEFDTIKDEVNSFLDGIEDKEIKIGTVFEAEYDDDGNIIQGQSDEFIAEAQNIVNAAKMTAEEAQSYFNSIGFEPEFVMEPQPVEQESPIMVEETQVRGVTSGTYESNGKEVPWERPILETTSYQDGVKKYTGMMMKVAMSNDGTPKIKTLTKKAPPSMGNFSSSNKGGKKPGGGKKSSPAKPIKQTKKSEVVERYKEITDAIDDVTDATEKASSAADRLYGPEKIKALKQVIKLEEKHVQQLKEKRKEAYNYLSQDRAALDKAAADAGVSLSYDSMGNITNYTEEFSKLYEELAAVQQKANAFKDAEAQSDYVEKNVDPVQEKIDKLKEQQQQYEETRELIEDLDAEIREKENEIIDKKLEKLTYPIELQIEVDTSQLEYLDYLLSKIEDRAFSSAQRLSTLQGKQQYIDDQIDQNYAGLGAVLSQTLSPEDLAKAQNNQFDDIDFSKYSFTDNQMEKIKEYRSNLISLNEDYLELAKTIHDEVSNAFEEWTEEISSQMELFEGYSELIDSMKNISGLMGTFIDDELMLSLTRAQTEMAQKAVTNAQANHQAALSYYDDLKAKVAELPEEEQKKWKKQLEEAEKNVIDTQKSVYEALDKAISASYEEYLAKREAQTKKFEQQITGKKGGLSEMEKDLERKKELAERYLNTYQEVYHLNKLNRDIQNSIDSTDSIKAKQTLLDLQKKIVATQKSGQKISQYQLDYMQKEYELRLAQIALEEAQNAKDMVRLSRDDEGNWGYIYTADEEKSASAKQQYEDKLYEIQELSNNYLNETASNILGSMNKFTEALAEIDENMRNGVYKNEEEYHEAQEKARAEFLEDMEYYGSEMDIAIDNNAELYHTDWSNYNWAVGGKIEANRDFQTSFEDTRYGVESGLHSVHDVLSLVTKATGAPGQGGLLGEMSTAYTDWASQVKQAMGNADLDVNTYQKHFGENSNTIIKKGGEVTENIQLDTEKMSGYLQSVINTTIEWEKQHLDSMNAIIAKNEETVESYLKMEEAFNRQARAEANLRVEEQKRAAAAQQSASPKNSGKDGSNNNDGDNSSKVKSDSDPKKEPEPSPDKTSNEPFEAPPEYSFLSGVGAHYSNKKTNSTWWYTGRQEHSGNYSYYEVSSRKNGGGTIGFVRKEEGADTLPGAGEKDKAVRNEAGSVRGISLYSIAPFDTGGYTGLWGPEGRLALLHEKELVLNAEDTKNMLDIVQNVRDIMSNINIRTLTGLNSSVQPNPTNNIQQEITIHAEFPNATEHSEIEEAFNNLINSASQYINR